VTRAAAKTGINPIALIAIEQYYPQRQRIVEDGLAYRMLPTGSRIFVKLMQPNWVRNWIIRQSEKSLLEYGAACCAESDMWMIN
jgi:hypothetical protein